MDKEVPAQKLSDIDSFTVRVLKRGQDNRDYRRLAGDLLLNGKANKRFARTTFAVLLIVFGTLMLMATSLFIPTKNVFELLIFILPLAMAVVLAGALAVSTIDTVAPRVRGKDSAAVDALAYAIKVDGTPYPSRWNQQCARARARLRIEKTFHRASIPLKGIGAKDIRPDSDADWAKFMKTIKKRIERAYAGDYCYNARRKSKWWQRIDHEHALRALATALATASASLLILVSTKLFGL
ncbi:MAG: hypothetical protein FWD18_09675 [Micrococcales bacterium]|nr:hypothetical protein [Micrococcales bacterium]